MFAVIRPGIAKPTTMRVARPITVARYSQPSPVRSDWSICQFLYETDHQVDHTAPAPGGYCEGA
jgi:hypothetical protein